MYCSFQGLWILGIVFGVLMIFGGLKALLTSRSESYDQRSLGSNMYGSIAVFILGIFLLFYSWGRVAGWLRF